MHSQEHFSHFQHFTQSFAPQAALNELGQSLMLNNSKELQSRTL